MLNNNSSELYYNKGIMQYEKGQYDLSIENFEKAIGINPSNFNFYYNLGLAYVKKEDYDLAIENFKKGIDLNPEDADLHHNLGIAYSNKAEFNKAIESYKKAIEIKPDDPASYDNLGIAYFSSNNYNDAILNFNCAVGLNPENPSFCYNLSYTYFVSEQYDLAKKFLLRTISLNQDDEEAYFNLGNVYLKQNDHKLAKENFEKTLSLNPDHEEAKLALTRLTATDVLKPEETPEIKPLAEPVRISRAEKPKEELVQDMKVEAEKNYKSGIVFLKNKELEQAIAELRRAVILKNDYIEAKNALECATNLLNESNILIDKGLSYFARNKFGLSIDSLQKALAIKPHDKQIKELLDRVEKKSEWIEKNKKAYRSYIENGKYDLAVATIKKTILECPLDPDIHFELGIVAIKQENYALAIESLKKAASVAPDRKDIQDALFKLMKRINNNSI